MLENYHHSWCFRKVFRHESKNALTPYIKSNLLTFDLYPNFKKDKTIIVADAVTYIIKNFFVGEVEGKKLYFGAWEYFDMVP